MTKHTITVMRITTTSTLMIMTTPAAVTTMPTITDIPTVTGAERTPPRAPAW
jgi:hypothetical protein